MKQNFYVTTPIYYWNWLLHVGHFYTSTISNIIYKYNKIHGKNARFTTWIDENSQKSVIKAQEENMHLEDYLDKMALKHQKFWDHFNFDYTDFIRTTSDRHHEIVSDVLQHCFDKWDIYKWFYEWMYCIWCEAFKKDEDLIEIDSKKVCPDHLKEPEQIKEKNYFFSLSKYETWIKEFYKNNQFFVRPDFRFNEVKAFVNRGLEDFSISREKNSFWIPLPFDKTQVTYVWFDALFNYYTSCKKSRAWDKNNKNFIDESNFWIRKNPKSWKIVHSVWKDIIRFHAIFWPAMLASYFDLWESKDGVIHFKESDFKYLPDTILTWWFFTVDWQKMSKSLGNVIEPISYCEQYSKELLTLYMLSAFNIWNDWDYDKKDAILMYNSKLANNLGNLLNRVVVLSLKLGLKLDWEIKIGNLSNYLNSFDIHMENYNLKNALDLNFDFLDSLNRFADEKQPWKTIKDESKKQETQEILYNLAEWLRQVGFNLYCFFPEKIWEMFTKLWLHTYTSYIENGNLLKLRNKKEVFNINEKWEVLFPRFDLD